MSISFQGLVLSIAFLSGVILLKENVSIFNILGVLLIIWGILTIFYKGRKLKPTSEFIFALFADILLRLIAYFDKKALEYTSPLSLIFIYFVSSNMLFFSIQKDSKI